MGEQIFFGLLLLVALVGYQTGHRYWQQHRMMTWWERAKAAWVENDLPAAERALVKCLKYAPLAVSPRVLLGNALARQGKLTEAEEHLRMAAELQPREPEGHLELGLFYGLNCENRIADAARALKAAVACAPGVADRIRRDPRFEDLIEIPEVRSALE